MKAWLLIVMFNTVDDAKVAVFKTKSDCEMYKAVTEQTFKNKPEVKSIECVQGNLKGDKG